MLQRNWFLLQNAALGLILLLSLFGLTAAERVAPADIVPAGFGIRATPLAPASLGVRRARGAPLDLDGAWQLESDDKDFGGLSALLVHGNRLLAVSDAGALLNWQMRPGLWPASIDPLPEGCRQRLRRYDRDSESITVEPGSGTHWIGIEVRNALCRIERGGRTAQTRPPEMANWSETAGPEAILRLRDGRFLVFGEDVDARYGNTSPLLVFARDPLAGGPPPRELRVRPPNGYNAVDAAQLPDGRILLLTRRFELPFRFSAILTVIDRLPLDGTPIEPQPLAWLDGKAGENWEGVAVDTGPDGSTHIWLVSDDNFLWLQRTLLLHFTLGAEVPRPAR